MLPEVRGFDLEHTETLGIGPNKGSKVGNKGLYTNDLRMDDF